MFRARFIVGALIATAAFAQSTLENRIRHALPADDAEAAAQALSRSDFDVVENLLTRSAKNTTDPERSELLALRGAVEFLEGNARSAAEAFLAARSLAPLNDSDSFTLAMASVKLGNLEQARTVLGDLQKQYPARALYLYWLGRLDYNQRRYDDAVDKLTRATELDPRSARAWDSLGLTFDMQGRREQALSAFQKARDLNREQPTHSPWPPHDFGYLLLRMDLFRQAETALRESLRYDSSLAQTHLYLGRVLEKEQQPVQASAEYLAAILLDKTSPDACYSLALLYRKLHRDKEAQQMFSKYRERRQASELATASQDGHSR